MREPDHNDRARVLLRVEILRTLSEQYHTTFARLCVSFYFTNTILRVSRYEPAVSV